MKALVLAAGFGTRLGEVGRKTPKCLMEVSGKPMLEHVLDRLFAQGIRDVVINLHHLADKVEQFVVSKTWPLQIRFSKEKEILGTGGALKFARKYFADTDLIVMHNADVYSEINLSELVTAHKQIGAVATLAIMQRETKRPLFFDNERKLVGWRNEKGEELRVSTQSAKPFAFSGIQVVSGRIFEVLDKFPDFFSIISAYLEAVRDGFPVCGYDIGSQYWKDVGTVDQLKELEVYLNRGK